MIFTNISILSTLQSKLSIIWKIKYCFTKWWSLCGFPRSGALLELVLANRVVCDWWASFFCFSFRFSCVLVWWSNSLYQFEIIYEHPPFVQWQGLSNDHPFLVPRFCLDVMLVPYNNNNKFFSFWKEIGKKCPTTTRSLNEIRWLKVPKKGREKSSQNDSKNCPKQLRLV